MKTYRTYLELSMVIQIPEGGEKALGKVLSQFREEIKRIKVPLPHSLFELKTDVMGIDTIPNQNWGEGS